MTSVVLFVAADTKRIALSGIYGVSGWGRVHDSIVKRNNTQMIACILGALG